MSAPIDELLIAVRIEQGSNLWAFYKMLKDLQKAAGGNFKSIKDTTWFTKAMWNGMITRLENIRDCCKALHELLPDIKESLAQQLDGMFQGMADAIVIGIRDLLEMQIQTQLDSNTEVLAGLDKDIKDLIEDLKDMLNDLKKDTKDIPKILEKLTGTKIDTHMKAIRKKFDDIWKNKQKFEPDVMNKLQYLENRMATMEGAVKYELSGLHRILRERVDEETTQEQIDMAIATFHTELEESMEVIHEQIKRTQEELEVFKLGWTIFREDFSTDWDWMKDQVRLTLATREQIGSLDLDIWDYKQKIQDRMFESRQKLRDAVDGAAEKGASKVLGDLGEKLTIASNQQMNTLYDTIEGLFDVIKFGDPELPHPSYGQSEMLWKAMEEQEGVQEIFDLTRARKEREIEIKRGEVGAWLRRDVQEIKDKQDETLGKLDDIDPGKNVAEKSRDQDIQGKKENMEK